MKNDILPFILVEREIYHLLRMKGGYVITTDEEPRLALSRFSIQTDIIASNDDTRKTLDVFSRSVLDKPLEELATAMRVATHWNLTIKPAPRHDLKGDDIAITVVVHKVQPKETDDALAQQ